MEEQIEQTNEKSRAKDVSGKEKKRVDKSLEGGSRNIYDRDFSTAEVFSVLTFGLGSFIGIASVASFGMLELVDYVFAQVGAQNNSLWVLMLFGLNAAMVTLMSKTLLPVMVRVTYKIHRTIKRELGLS